MKGARKKKENRVSTQELFFQVDKLSVIHRNIEKFLDKLFKEKQIELVPPQKLKNMKISPIFLNELSDLWQPVGEFYL